MNLELRFNESDDARDKRTGADPNVYDLSLEPDDDSPGIAEAPDAGGAQTPPDLSRFTPDQLHDISIFDSALTTLYNLVIHQDYIKQIQFIRHNIGLLREIAHNSTGLLAYDERQEDDLVYATSLVMRKNCGIDLIQDLIDNYGDLDVWDYLPE